MLTIFSKWKKTNNPKLSRTVQKKTILPWGVVEFWKTKNNWGFGDLQFCEQSTTYTSTYVEHASWCDGYRTWLFMERIWRLGSVGEMRGVWFWFWLFFGGDFGCWVHEFFCSYFDFEMDFDFDCEWILSGSMLVGMIILWPSRFPICQFQGVSTFFFLRLKFHEIINFRTLIFKPKIFSCLLERGEVRYIFIFSLGSVRW